MQQEAAAEARLSPEISPPGCSRAKRTNVFGRREKSQNCREEVEVVVSSYRWNPTFRATHKSCQAYMLYAAAMEMTLYVHDLSALESRAARRKRCLHGGVFCTHSGWLLPCSLARWTIPILLSMLPVNGKRVCLVGHAEPRRPEVGSCAMSFQALANGLPQLDKRAKTSSNVKLQFLQYLFLLHQAVGVPFSSSLTPSTPTRHLKAYATTHQQV